MTRRIFDRVRPIDTVTHITEPPDPTERSGVARAQTQPIRVDGKPTDRSIRVLRIRRIGSAAPDSRPSQTKGRLPA